MSMKNKIKEIVTMAGTTWFVGEIIKDGVSVNSIEEVFHKPVPIYRVEYSDGTWFEIPVSSVEFVSGYMK